MSTLDDLVNQSARPVEKDYHTIECDILMEAADQLARERRQQAVTACKGLLDRFTMVMKNSVDHLRTLRASERKMTSAVATMDRALAFFSVTGNPLPFFAASGDVCSGNAWCRNCGIPVPPNDSPDWKVPADFVDKKVDKK